MIRWVLPFVLAMGLIVPPVASVGAGKGVHGKPDGIEVESVRYDAKSGKVTTQIRWNKRELRQEGRDELHVVVADDGDDPRVLRHVTFTATADHARRTHQIKLSKKQRAEVGDGQDLIVVATHKHNHDGEQFGRAWHHRLSVGATTRASEPSCGAIGSYSQRSYCDLSYADLSGMNLRSAILGHVNLQFANLSYTNLEGSGLGGSDLSGANLTGANLNSSMMSGTTFAHANMSGISTAWAYIWGANLQFADLTGANLSYGRLEWSDFTGANLARANLTGTVLSSSDMTDTNLTGATLCNTVMPDNSTNNANC